MLNAKFDSAGKNSRRDCISQKACILQQRKNGKFCESFLKIYLESVRKAKTFEIFLSKSKFVIYSMVKYLERSKYKSEWKYKFRPRLFGAECFIILCFCLSCFKNSYLQYLRVRKAKLSFTRMQLK
jgi:hypothetical protein